MLPDVRSGRVLAKKRENLHHNLSALLLAFHLMTGDVNICVTAEVVEFERWTCTILTVDVIIRVTV